MAQGLRPPPRTSTFRPSCRRMVRRVAIWFTYARAGSSRTAQSTASIPFNPASLGIQAARYPAPPDRCPRGQASQVAHPSGAQLLLTPTSPALLASYTSSARVPARSLKGTAASSRCCGSADCKVVAGKDSRVSRVSRPLKRAHVWGMNVLRHAYHLTNCHRPNDAHCAKFSALSPSAARHKPQYLDDYSQQAAVAPASR